MIQESIHLPSTIDITITDVINGRYASSEEVAAVFLTLPTLIAGATDERPPSPMTGHMYFDTTLGQPIWWDGSEWVDADGGLVDFGGGTPL